jgi:hypothetical protein
MHDDDRYIRLYAPTVPDARYVSNFNRIALASVIPTMFYLDCDITLKERPAVTGTLPLFGVHKSSRLEPCICAFYVNHRCDFFRTLMDNTPNGGFCEALRGLNVELLPDSCYIHKPS